MGIVFSHTSALDALRAFTAYDGCASADYEALAIRQFDRVGWRRFKSIATTAREAAHAPEGTHRSLRLPVHFMVPHATAFRKGAGAVCHVITSPLPTGSLVALNRNDLCAGPELCFYQLACAHSLPLVVKAGYELCGMYNLDSYSDAGFNHRHPLTDVSAIARYLDRLGRRPGVRPARSALRFVVEGAASPRETLVSMLLTMPRRLGGYGLPVPQLNRRPATGASTTCPYVCDMIWQKQRVIVEYDSDAWHEGQHRIGRDAARRVALENTGFHVVTITNRQVQSLREMDDVALLLAKLLGVRMRDSTGHWKGDRIRLREELLATDC